jgi:hypothetical protein
MSLNIKINKDKFMLREKEMPYIGHLLTAKGVKPDQEKIAAITNMEKPTDVKGLHARLVYAIGWSFCISVAPSPNPEASN